MVYEDFSIKILAINLMFSTKFEFNHLCLIYHCLLLVSEKNFSKISFHNEFLIFKWHFVLPFIFIIKHYIQLTTSKFLRILTLNINRRLKLALTLSSPILLSSPTKIIISWLFMHHVLSIYEYSIWRKYKFYYHCF